MKVLGHDREKEIFERILKEDRLHHAYILSGRSGSGKKLFAAEVARSIVCENGSFMSDCGCRHCVSALNGSHPDIHMVEEVPMKIETARNLCEEAFMSPMTAKKKVYIIDGIDACTQYAANAMLKTLEEPPQDTYFFLITDKYQQVLHTIRSRSVNIAFGMLSDDTVAEIVRAHTDKSDDEIARAVSISSGSAGHAIYLLNSAEHQPVFTGVQSKKQLYEEISSLEDKDAVRSYCASLYAHLLEKYKESGNETMLDFSNYLLDILKRLEYNVSLDMFRLDLYIKTIEVLSENS